MDVIFLFLFFLIFWVVIATVLGGVIGERKGRTGAGVALGLFLGWVGVIIIAVMQPSEEVQRKRREEQGDIYLKALEAHGGGGGGSSASGVQIPARELIVVEAIKRDPTLVGVTDPEGLKRLADAITLIENEFRTREELRNATELIAKQEHEQELMQETARLTEESRQKEQEATRAKAEEVERAKVARELQIAAMSPAKRWVVLHKPVSLLILAVVVLALIAGGYGYSTSLANQEAQRVAAAAAVQAEADAAAAAVQAEVDAAADAAADAARKAACLLGSECNVGDIGPGGGLVFYDAGSVKPWGRYLEAGPELAAEGWCDDWQLDVAGTKFWIGAGEANTKLIAAACGAGAANTVSDYDVGGKTDWFLPSGDELNALNEQQAGLGGFASVFYWSSSQGDARGAWAQILGDGSANSVNKYLALRVRPVRAF